MNGFEPVSLKILVVLVVATKFILSTMAKFAKLGLSLSDIWNINIAEE